MGGFHFLRGCGILPTLCLLAFAYTLSLFSETGYLGEVSMGTNSAGTLRPATTAGAQAASSTSRGWVYKARKTLRRPQFWFGVCVLVPTLLWYGYFMFGPIIRGVFMSFTSMNFTDPSRSRFIGIANFQLVTQHFLFPIS